MTLRAPEGIYTVCYEAADEWDGRIKMTIGGVPVCGEVLLVEIEKDGGRAFMGPTSGFNALYNDEFWFELRPDRQPPMIEYFADRVLWRRDEGL